MFTCVSVKKQPSKRRNLSADRAREVEADLDVKSHYFLQYSSRFQLVRGSKGEEHAEALQESESRLRENSLSGWRSDPGANTGSVREAWRSQ
jgi:hypothetical protein